MENGTIVITIKFLKQNREEDVEVPVHITANELIIGLNEAYRLGIDTNDVLKSFLRAENPIVLLRGNRTLAECGLRNGSMIMIND